MDELSAVIRGALTEKEYPDMTPYVDAFRRKYPRGLLGVVFYGSRLWESTATLSSFPDFFLIVDEYTNFYDRRFHAFLNRRLPPNIFYLSETVRRGDADVPLKCKYNVVSLDRLERELGPGAKDLYLLGRFSKRVALLYASEGTVADRLAAAIRSALLSLTPHALLRTAAGGVDDFGKALLKLSYEGEVRVEKTDEKVDQLYNACRDYYRSAFTVLLKSYGESEPRLRVVLQDGVASEFAMDWTAKEKERVGRESERLIKRSRRRGVARWPKGILLTDNWVDILLDKVERTYGYRIVLTPLERRFVLILGWRHFFRLRREGKIK